MVTDPAGIPAEALAAMEKHALLNASQHGGRADVGAVVSRVLGEFPSLRDRAAAVATAAREAVGKVNAMEPQAQSRLLDERYPGSRPAPKGPEAHSLPPLQGAVKGKAVFRLPPEPGGFMHVGNAMAFTVNSLYRDMYEGELWLRFEDTNPKKVARKYYDSFRRGLSWLGIRYDHEKCISQDMDLMYDYGRRMVKDGLAYACSCGPDRAKQLRFEGNPCEHREATPDWSLGVWEELLAKEHGEGEFVIRFKGEMGSPNYSLRDPNVFRVIEAAHPLTGDRYTLWPTYHLANTIEDHVCGVTHILRSSEFNAEVQALIRRSLGLRDVEVVQFSRYNFRGTPLAKRLLRPLVEQGLVSGWDDPRMPTVEGVQRRGILPQAIRDFTQLVGYTKAEHEYDWSILFSLNRKLLDPVARRFFFVPDPARVSVEGAPARTVTLPFHPEKDLGSRPVETRDEFHVPSADLALMKKGALFRLMDLYNVELLEGGEHPRLKYAGEELLPDTRKVQWVTGAGTAARVTIPDVLFDDAGEFNKDSLREARGLCEGAAAAIKPGEVVQFPRFGFCRLDSPGEFILAHR